MSAHDKSTDISAAGRVEVKMQTFSRGTRCFFDVKLIIR